MLGSSTLWAARPSSVLPAALAMALAMRGARAQAQTQAQPPSFSLSWQAPAGCPSEDRVRRALEQLLDERPPPLAQFSARAVVEHKASGRWTVRLTSVRDGATGERVIEAASCQSLADATALVVAVLIDPEGVGGHAPGASSAPEPGPVPPPQPQPPSQPPPPVAPPATDVAKGGTPAVPAPAAPTPEHVSLFALVGADVGTLSRPGLALRGGPALTLGRFRAEAYATYLPPQAAAAAALPMFGTHIHLLAGGLRGCFLAIRGTLQAAACAGVELGELRGQGYGPALAGPMQSFTPTSAGGLWAAPTLGVCVSWQVTRRFAVVWDAGLIVPVLRNTFVIDHLGGSALLEPSPVAVRAAIGPEVRF